MTLLETHEHLIREKLADLPQGKEAGLKVIFGDQWEAIGDPGERKEFGHLFKAAVSSKKYPDIEWVRIENSGRFDVYRKI